MKTSTPLPIREMHTLEEMPPQLGHNKILQKVFRIGEIAKFNKMERARYQESLKNYRDFQNTLNYAKKEGKKEQAEISVMSWILEFPDLSDEKIAKLNKVSVEFVQNIRKKLSNG